MVNSFGTRFKITTFGESHGKALGVVVDGVPAGLTIDEVFIQSEMDRRKPGTNKLTTKRKESDKVQILSGVFEGVSTGTPIGILIVNENQKSKDYDNIKDIFRPGHADMTYFFKYGLRDFRGGGRSSARETACRVASGAIAKLILNTLNIKISSGVSQIGDIKAKKINFEYAKESDIYALDETVEQSQKDLIKKTMRQKDSVGAVVKIKVDNCPVGLGEPMYHKVDAKLFEALGGLNAVKAVSIGAGFGVGLLKGSQNNDKITKDGFSTNNSGGILGGITNGDDIDIDVYFKPTPSISKPQQTIDTNGANVCCEIKGRHDPCVGIRGSVVCESMVAIVLVDMLLLNTTSKMQNILKIYGTTKK
ncbi:MAG: chorismate synthase [Epsilonproteobacteria bacterium]|nr:MAG: chorismate synthase [Campylobacterota bacterium]